MADNIIVTDQGSSRIGGLSPSLQEPASELKIGQTVGVDTNVKHKGSTGDDEHDVYELKRVSQNEVEKSKHHVPW